MLNQIKQAMRRALSAASLGAPFGALFDRHRGGVCGCGRGRPFGRWWSWPKLECRPRPLPREVSSRLRLLLSAPSALRRAGGRGSLLHHRQHLTNSLGPTMRVAGGMSRGRWAKNDLLPGSRDRRLPPLLALHLHERGPHRKDSRFSGSPNRFVMKSKQWWLKSDNWHRLPVWARRTDHSCTLFRSGLVFVERGLSKASLAFSNA